MIVLLFQILSCAPPEADPCAAMCSSATQVYGACLSDWGADWSDAGYSDERDYFHACETWAWEFRILEKQAKRDGEVSALGNVDATCESNEQALETSVNPCDTWSAIEWENVPW